LGGKENPSFNYLVTLITGGKGGKKSFFLSMRGWRVSGEKRKIWSSIQQIFDIGKKKKKRKGVIFE